MNIRTIKHYSELNQEEPTVLVLGYFDGIHLGHKALLDRARQVADEKDCQWPYWLFQRPLVWLFARFTPELLLHLTSQDQRYHLLEQYGVDQLVLTDFTSEFASNTPQQFWSAILKVSMPRFWSQVSTIILEIAEQMWQTWQSYLMVR